MLMAGNYATCTTLLAAMDGLWYHRLILFHPSDLISVQEPASSESFTSSYDSYQSSSCTSITEQDHVLSDQSLLTPQQVQIFDFTIYRFSMFMYIYLFCKTKLFLAYFSNNRVLVQSSKKGKK